SPLMASLQVDPARPALTSEQTLTGWRREFCVELLGEGQARRLCRNKRVGTNGHQRVRWSPRRQAVEPVGIGYDQAWVAAELPPLDHPSRGGLTVQRRRNLPPHRPHRAGLPQWVPQVRLAAPAQDRVIRGTANG